jgi:hypothetical protein
MFMMEGDVPGDSQNKLGNLGSKERQHDHYALASLDVTTVLTMGGTAKTERGQHHNPMWNRVQPVDELITYLLPVTAEWEEVLKNRDHAKWQEDWAKLTFGHISFGQVS